MTDKKLSILAITAVIAAGFAVLQSRLAHQGGPSEISSGPLIQGLDVQAIAKIQVVSEKGKTTVTLTKTDSGFKVDDKDGYPASVSAINRLLNNCLDIRVTERITSNPDNHADLGVTEETARYAVRFFSADDKEITGLLMSETKSDPDGAYARLTTSNDTYFIQDPPWLSTRAMDFVNADLATVERDKIQQVAVRGPENEYVLTAADDGQTINLKGMPDGKQFKGTTYRSVFGAMTSLQFEDVTAADKAPQNLSFDRTFVCKLKDTTVYTVKLAKQDDKTYATVTAEFLDQSPVQVARNESEEDLKKKEAKLLAMDAAGVFAKKHKGWVYTLASYKAEDLTKSLDDLLEDKPKDEPAPAGNAPAAGEAAPVPEGA